MPKKLQGQKSILKKIYVTEKTWANLFAQKYANGHKNMDEVIVDLFKRATRDSSK